MTVRDSVFNGTRRCLASYLYTGAPLCVIAHVLHFYSDILIYMETLNKTSRATTFEVMSDTAAQCQNDISLDLVNTPLFYLSSDENIFADEQSNGDYASEQHSGVSTQGKMDVSEIDTIDEVMEIETECMDFDLAIENMEVDQINDITNGYCCKIKNVFQYLMIRLMEWHVYFAEALVIVNVSVTNII